MSQKAYNRNFFIYLTRVWITVFKKSVSKSLAYRFEALSRVIRTALIVGTQMILVQSIFSGGGKVVGWDVYDYYLLIGIFNFVNYLSWGFFNVNLWRLEEKIVNGEYDFLLLYPTGSIFSSSFIEFFLDDALASLSGLVFIIFYLVERWSELTLISVFGGIIAIVAAMILWFAIHLAVASLNFVSVKNGLLDLTKSLTKVGSFPIDIFPESYRYLLYTLFPVAFIAAVPARLLSGFYSFQYVLIALGIALLFVNIAFRIWRRAIVSYSSFGG